MENIQSYKNGGFNFEIIKREGNIAIAKGKNKKGSVCFEVFKVKEQKESISNFGGVEVTFKAKESKPKDNDFGKDAFSYGELMAALKKFEELVNI